MIDQSNSQTAPHDSAHPSTPPTSQPPCGRPAQSPHYYEAQSAPVPTGPSKAVLGMMCAGLLLAAGGIVYKVVHKPEPRAPVVRAPSPWEQQQQMMREALDMAREAQQLQRERQEEMRRAMEVEYGGVVEPGTGDW